MPDPAATRGNILRVVEALVLRPAAAWEALASAPLDLPRIWRHLLTLGAIGPVALFFGTWLFNAETFQIDQAIPLTAGSPMSSAVSEFVFPLGIPLPISGQLPGLLNAARSALAFYVAQLVIMLLTAGLIWLLAPYCQARRDARAALAVVVYGSTPLLLSAVGLVKMSYTLLLAVGMLHSCVIAQRGVRRLLGAHGNDASMLLGITVMALYVLVPVLAYVAALVGVPLIG